MDQDQASAKEPDVRGEGQLLQALVAYWIHADTLYWAQINHLLVLQLAAFAGWYALRRSVLAVALMVASALISFGLYWLAKRIRINRNSNEEAIRVLSLSVASPSTRAQMREFYERAKPNEGTFERFGLFRYAEHEGIGRQFQFAIFGICIAANLIVAGLTVAALTGPSRMLGSVQPRFSDAASSTSRTAPASVSGELRAADATRQPDLGSGSQPPASMPERTPIANVLASGAARQPVAASGPSGPPSMPERTPLVTLPVIPSSSARR